MIKKTFTSALILLLFVAMSCKERYPDLEDGLYAEFVTNKDTMVAKLFYKDVPVTVANFVALAEGDHPLVKDEFKGKKYYNGIIFHRVMNNFMIQGGDPTGTGSGDPGYKFEDEFRPNLKHDKPGILSMANSGPATNGSQFFITEKPTPWLDAFQPDGTLKQCSTQPGGSCHTVFGELVRGLDVQDAISNVPLAPGTTKPVDDVIILELNIIRKGTDAKNFKAAKVFNEELANIPSRMEDAKKEGLRLAEEARKEEERKVQDAKNEFLKKNEEIQGRRKEFPTGLAMIYTHESDGVKPNSSQSVKIDCAGYFESGELFWTTWKEVAEKNGKYDKAQDDAGYYAPFAMPYNQQATLVAGFREAMLNMKIGDKARVFIPHYLGYGETGRAPLIPPRTNLVFDIELVGLDDGQ